MSKRTYFLILIAALILAASPVVANDNNRVALVVVFGDGNVHTECVSFPEQDLTGFDLLDRSSLDVITGFDPSQGASVCKLNDLGCGENNCFCQYPDYWSYWHIENGQWIYSQYGASNWRVSDGDIDGWRWGTGVQPPVFTFDEICAPLPTNTLSPTITNTPQPTSAPTNTPTASTVPPTSTNTPAPTNTVPPSPTTTQQAVGGQTSGTSTATSAPANTPLPSATQQVIPPTTSEAYPEPQTSQTMIATPEVMETSQPELTAEPDVVSQGGGISIATSTPEVDITSLALVPPTLELSVPQAGEAQTIQEAAPAAAAPKNNIFQNGLMVFGILAVALGGVLFFAMTQKKL